MKRTYKGVAYRQANDPQSPWIISLVAPAEEILDWAGIPRRTTDPEMAGFQRAFDPARVEKAKKFFDIGVNQSPTSVVIGIHPAPNANAPPVKLTFDNDEASSIRSCALEIDYPGDLNETDVVAYVRGHIAARISRDSAELAEEDVEPEPEDEAIAAEDEDEASVDDTDHASIELGRSLLLRLNERLDDPAWCRNNLDALNDLAKPATVIDGQHRLKGAEKCERGIPFSVCALYPCEWAEQVFQFTVVNYTQKGIPDQFITANAALSLTPIEMKDLTDRLVQAGVHVTEYDLMKVVNFHDRSPFKNLVNLTEKKDHAKIGYKTMVRVAREWFDARHQIFRTFLQYLYPDLSGKGAHKNRVARWREEDWGVFFLDFWSIVYETYADKQSHVPGHHLWDVNDSNLIIAIVLYELQLAFLNHVNAQDETFWQSDSTLSHEARLRELRERWMKRAKIFVQWFPAEFFGEIWKQKSLSVGPGRKALQDCFQQLVITKGGYRYAKCGLVTGQTAG
jgi:hypothetical protein